MERRILCACATEALEDQSNDGRTIGKDDRAITRIMTDT